MRLVNPVDAISEKSEKYVEHGTKVIKLVSLPIRKRLLALAKEES
jgi:hypothetical protein